MRVATAIFKDSFQELALSVHSQGGRGQMLRAMGDVDF